MASRKPWRDLSDSYRKRLSRHGITEKNYNTPAADKLRQAARGHEETPERPERAVRHPERYRKYLESTSDLVRRVQLHKTRLFHDRIKFNPRRSDANARKNPTTGKPMRKDLALQFLRMTEDDIDDVDWSADDWAVFFYH